MMKKIEKIILLILLSTFIIACKNQSINQGKQYKLKLVQNVTKINIINTTTTLINPKSFLLQIQEIKRSSPSLYLKNKLIYNRITNWIKNYSIINQLNKFGIDSFQMKGIDNYGNVKITGYYTPIIEARTIKNDRFKYPIYSMPYHNKNEILPKRKDIYNGILDKKYILA
ncbi:MltA domain-containing protein, partial [Buchnera aphidicola]|uniref:MltA domain-containing protein n=1 Tax=Buchnera aphidicola TaxID=9 RepID=UPI003F59F902